MLINKRKEEESKKRAEEFPPKKLFKEKYKKKTWVYLFSMRINPLKKHKNMLIKIKKNTKTIKIRFREDVDGRKTVFLKFNPPFIDIYFVLLVLMKLKADKNYSKILYFISQ